MIKREHWSASDEKETRQGGKEARDAWLLPRGGRLCNYRPATCRWTPRRPWTSRLLFIHPRRILRLATENLSNRCAIVTEAPSGGFKFVRKFTSKKTSPPTSKSRIAFPRPLPVREEDAAGPLTDAESPVCSLLRGHAACVPSYHRGITAYSVLCQVGIASELWTGLPHGPGEALKYCLIV